MTLTTQLTVAEDGLMTIILAQQALPLNPLAGVNITLGHPGTRLMPEHIWIGEAASTAIVPDVTGTPGKTFEETFELHVLIYVQKEGNDYKALRDRAHALAAEIESAVFADRTLGAAIWDAWPAALDRRSGAAERMREMEIDLKIEGVAYLS